MAQQQLQQNSQQQQQYQSVVQQNQFYQSGINQSTGWNSTNAQQSTLQQQLQPQIGQSNQSQFQANFIQSLQTSITQPQQQQQQQQATNSLFQQQQYMPLPIVNDVIVKQEYQVPTPVTVVMPKTELIESATYQLQQQQQYPVEHMQQQHQQQPELQQQQIIIPTKSVTPQVNLNTTAEMLPKTNQSNR